MRTSAVILIILGLLISLLTGCASKKVTVETSPPLTEISQIDSFKPEIACQQGLEVINNNPYQEAFFDKVFEKIVAQSANSASPDNADIIWEHFVVPLRQSGKVPPDMAKNKWNYYFSSHFVSLPAVAPIGQQCYRLSEIKKNMEIEYRFKKEGFEICQQGSPDSHFLNAMYVYNTMWAACKGTD